MARRRGAREPFNHGLGCFICHDSPAGGRRDVFSFEIEKYPQFAEDLRDFKDSWKFEFPSLPELPIHIEFCLRCYRQQYLKVRRLNMGFELVSEDKFLHDGYTYGGIDMVLGTGRAKCRICGLRVEKGAEAFQAYVDMGGSGSWTSVLSTVHRPCVPSLVKEFRVGGSVW